MPGFKCPFCGNTMSTTKETYVERKFNFDNPYIAKNVSFPHILVRIYRCPDENCRQESVILEGVGGYAGGRILTVYPESSAIHFPAHIVPESIRADYEEACDILGRSPKAAATLARRCLQGMIRDVWKVTGKRSLFQEIDEIKGKIPLSQWYAINDIRSIGNIGAHMEEDVNRIIDVKPYEAQQLLSLIELLIKKWYVEQYEEEQLYAELHEIAKDKDSAKKS